MKGTLNEKFLLPTTIEGLEKRIEETMDAYKQLTDKDQATATICHMIMHQEPSNAMSSIQEMGHRAIKNMAYQVASALGMATAKKNQVAGLVQILTENPNNNQAKDALQKMADEGVEIAKIALAGFEPKEAERPTLTAVPASGAV